MVFHSGIFGRLRKVNCKFQVSSKFMVPAVFPSRPLGFSQVNDAFFNGNRTYPWPIAIGNSQTQNPHLYSGSCPFLLYTIEKQFS